MVEKMRGADAACMFRTSWGLTFLCTNRPKTFYCDAIVESTVLDLKLSEEIMDKMIKPFQVPTQFLIINALLVEMNSIS